MRGLVWDAYDGLRSAGSAHRRAASPPLSLPAPRLWGLAAGWLGFKVCGREKWQTASWYRSGTYRLPKLGLEVLSTSHAASLPTQCCRHCFHIGGVLMAEVSLQFGGVRNVPLFALRAMVISSQQVLLLELLASVTWNFPEIAAVSRSGFWAKGTKGGKWTFEWMSCAARVQMVKKMGVVWLGRQSKLATCIAWRQLGSLPFQWMLLSQQYARVSLCLAEALQVSSWAWVPSSCNAWGQHYRAEMRQSSNWHIFSQGLWNWVWDSVGMLWPYGCLCLIPLSKGFE